MARSIKQVTLLDATSHTDAGPVFGALGRKAGFKTCVFLQQTGRSQLNQARMAIGTAELYLFFFFFFEARVIFAMLLFVYVLFHVILCQDLFCGV